MGVAEIRQPTIPHKLPPGAIADAAEADFRRRRVFVEESEAQRKLGSWGAVVSRPTYIFRADGVRQANSPYDLIERTIKTIEDPELSFVTTKHLLSIIIADIEILQHAALIARERYG